MRITHTLTLLVFIFGLAFADKEEDVIFKDAKVKPVVAPAPAKTGVAAPKKATVQVAQERQDTYGAPAAPAEDTYGPPAAPVEDSYGPPQAPVEAPPAPVQGEVGTQGYYYYYYPVASGSGSEPTKTTYSAPAASGGSSSLLIIGLLVGAVLLIGALAWILQTNNNRSFGSWLLNGYELDTNNLALKVHEAIELYNALYR